MQTINNFDQSSTGIDIEIEAFLDDDIARCYYRESFKHIKGNNDDIVYYTAVDELEPSFEAITTKDAHKFTKEQSGFLFAYHEYKVNSIEEYRDFCLQDLPKDYHERNRYIRQSQELGLPVKFKDNYAVERFNGYSQGDTHEVIFNLTALSSLWGKPEEEILTDAFRREIQHLLFNSPIFLKVTIKNRNTGEVDEGNYCEYAEDEYVYERERVLKAFPDYAEQLDKLLPKEIF